MRQCPLPPSPGQREDSGSQPNCKGRLGGDSGVKHMRGSRGRLPAFLLSLSSPNI